jgi:hypothetical protein
LKAEGRMKCAASRRHTRALYALRNWVRASYCTPGAS